MEDRTYFSLQAIEDETALELPDRQALSLVNANLALPVRLHLGC